MWLHDPIIIGYTVGGTYHLLTHLYSRDTSIHNDLIWNMLVPLKISIFAWRFINDRLPTKLNLFARGCLRT
jgi:hypothetical protein